MNDKVSDGVSCADYVDYHHMVDESRYKICAIHWGYISRHGYSRKGELMRPKTARWMLIDRNVRFVRMLPEQESFVADAYECSNCHNKTNDHEPLPDTCPWCKADMER